MFLKLLPSDVPGATLSCNLHDHSVQELRRWLECRGLNQSGRKEDLIKRIRNCIDNGRENEISIAIDGGKWYNRKRNADPTTSSSLVETLSKSSEVMFNPFPSVDVPEYFNKGHIYSYLILNVADHSDDFEILNEETGTMEKPLQKANQLLVSDHLSNLMDGSCENRYFIKCECKASFKNKIYNVHVTLNTFSGAVTKSKCECLESSTGKCSHVTALLLLLSKFVNENGCKVESVSTTSRIRQWRLGRKVCSPGSINTEHAMSRYQPIRRSTFDPRPSNYTRNFSVNDFVINLQGCNTRTLFETVLSITYEDFMYSEGELIIFKHLVSQFKNNMDNLLNKFSDNICEVCTQQNSEEWTHYRRYFLTGSLIKQVCGFKSPTAIKNYLQTNLWRSHNVRTASMIYGEKNEVNARVAYSKTLTEGEVLTNVGLVVNKKYPWLAGSIDNVVIKNGCANRLVEYKCPWILQKYDCRNFNLHLTPKQLSSFCLEYHGDEIRLKKNHKYAYQVALYLLIFEVDVCDLVIWSPVNYLIIKVNKRDYVDCIYNNMSKLREFYYNYFVPEMFMMRTVRNLNPIKLE